MRRIAEYKTGTTYSGRKSSNKYLKDWHTAETGETPDTHKYNLWYLRRIAQVYDPEFDMTSNENQCLELIADEISSTTSIKLTLSSNTVTVDGSVTLTALLLDEDRQPIQNATITFTDDGSFEETASTGSDGKATKTYTASSVGTIELTATYGDYSSSKSLTANKHTSSINMSADSTEVYMTGDVSLSGTLLIDGVGASGKSVDVCVLTDIDTWYVYDTITTGTDGAYEYEDSIFGDSEGIVTYRMTYNGDSKTDSSNSNSIAITVTKVPTTLTIDTPTIVYSDDFEVTGTVTRADGVPMNGVGITLNWSDSDGHSGTATTLTDIHGKATFSRSEPTSITRYTFQLVYNGFQDLKPSQSAQINVDVDKETSVLNITSPTTGASVSQADTITVTGTLKDNDDEVMSGKTVYAKLGNTTLETFTVDSNGDISGTISASDLNVGSNSIEFGFTATTEYTGSTQTVTVNKGLTYTKLEVEATNPILSYVDSESTDMTAQLLDNSDNPVALSGVTLYFRDGATLLGSAQTDATGKATLLNTYTSQGRGDVQITVDDGSLVTEIFAIEDCRKVYNSFKGTDFTKSETIYTSNDVFLDQSKVYMKFANFPNNFQLGIGEGSVNKLEFQQSPSYNVAYLYHGSSYESLSQKMTANTVLCFEINGTTGKFYYDDTLISTVTLNTSMANKIKAVVYSGNDFDVEYIKIKPL